MQLEQALKIFNLSPDYSHEDVETFYQFESSLLEERLTTGDDAQKLSNKQKIVELQAAYELLCAAAAPADKSTLAKMGSKKIIIYTLLGIIGTAAISASIFTLKKQQSANELAEQAKRQKIVDEAAAKARKQISQQQTSTKSETPSIRLSPQEVEFNQLESKHTDLLKKWQKINSNVDFRIPARFSNQLSKVQQLKDEGSMTQAIFVYQQYINDFSAHIDNISNYIQAFSQQDQYAKIWHQLATREHYTFNQLAQYQQQFARTRDQLEKGEIVEYTRESLEGINLRYKVIIAQGERIAKLRREYAPLKARWQRHVLGNRFYKLTPAISELIQTAEQKNHDASEFNTLEDQVYQRLINHFKQTLRR